MLRSPNLFAAHVLAALIVTFSCTSVFAQWLKHPTAGVPRTGNGKFNPSAPTPHTPDGKPDFSGIWLTDNPNCGGGDSGGNPDSLMCGVELPMSRAGINMGIGLPGGLPYQPWLAKLVKERTATDAKDDPVLDGRPLPPDPVPSWQGYSSATWPGDTLVVNSIGFRDDLWIDWNASGDPTMVTSRSGSRSTIRRPT
jgi:hypothetical protein